MIEDLDLGELGYGKEYSVVHDNIEKCGTLISEDSHEFDESKVITSTNNKEIEESFFVYGCKILSSTLGGCIIGNSLIPGIGIILGAFFGLFFSTGLSQKINFASFEQ